MANGGITTTPQALRASPAVSRAHHLKTVDDLKTGLSKVYVKPLEKYETSKEKVKHYKQVIECLKQEYVARIDMPDRQYRGTLTPRLSEKFCEF